MNGNVVVASADDPCFDASLKDGMFRLRHKVFYENLGWEVDSREGREVDRYDAMNPVYVLAHNRRREVEGTWRLLPTTGPYMLRDVFPQLLRGEEAPCDPAVWEISRFAVLPGDHRGSEQAVVAPITYSMLRAGVKFADRNGISSYVFVTSVALERLLRQVGMPIYRFGDKKAQRVGHVLSVACWIPITDETRRVVGLPVQVPEAA